MTGPVIRFKSIARSFRALARSARSPMSLASLLITRGAPALCDFRVGPLVLAARHADLTAVSETATQGEYAFLAECAMPRGALVLDVGANIGCFAAMVFAVCPSAEVHSVEPSPDTFEVLEQNRTRYRTLTWHTHRLAVSDRRGALLFENDGPSTARRLAAGTTGVLVRSETFDGLVEQIARGRRVFLCKIDVEGAEAQIFDGALESLGLIDHLVIEVHGPAALSDRITRRLGDAFDFVVPVPGRRSAKPLLHAWRDAPVGVTSTRRGASRAPAGVPA